MVATATPPLGRYSPPSKIALSVTYLHLWNAHPHTLACTHTPPSPTPYTHIRVCVCSSARARARARTHTHTHTHTHMHAQWIFILRIHRTMKFYLCVLSLENRRPWTLRTAVLLVADFILATVLLVCTCKHITRAVICCVSLVSTRKEARWSIRFVSLFTVDDEGYVQQTNKQNWTLSSNWDEKPCVATLSLSLSIYIYIQTEERSGKGNNQNLPEQLDLESSCRPTFKIDSDYACLKVDRETLRTIESFLEQSRSIQSNYSI